MQLIETPLKDLLVIQPKVFEDSRGYFLESYNKDVFARHNITDDFMQDNQSLSQKNVLRGLHFQNPPYAQAKLVRVIKGAVLDVVVDIRSKSFTYGKSYALLLTEQNRTMLYVPEGFAHGFLVKEDNTIFSYKCSRLYNKDSEGAISWNDPDLNIDWTLGGEMPILSEKDKAAPLFRNFISSF